VSGTTVNNLITIAKRDDLTLYINSAYNANLIVDAFATLYHANIITEIVGSVVIVPVDDMTDPNTIYWLAHKDKFAIGYYYDVVMSIVNPRDTYTNTFGHYAYGSGVFQLLPCKVGKVSTIP
jgi:hypothetical protein